MNSQSQGGVAARLQAQGQLDEAVLVAAKHHAKQQGLSLGAALLAQDGLDTQAFAEAASEAFGLPLFDLSAFDLRLAPRGLLKEAFLRKHQLLPLLRRGTTLCAQSVFGMRGGLRGGGCGSCPHMTRRCGK